MDPEPSRVLATITHVEATTATVWLDAPNAGALGWTLTGSNGPQRGHLTVEAGPTAVSLGDTLGAQLTPDTQYQLAIEGAEPLMFCTEPRDDSPDAQYALAIGSCHQPFLNDGSLDASALRTLRAFPAAAKQINVRGTLLLGDQMYADQPKRLSLYDRKVVRALSSGAHERAETVPVEYLQRWFERRYRAFFGVSDFRALMAAAPTYMVWDDHELWDNFGSTAAHRAPDRTPIIEAARRAYERYQRLGRPYGDGTPDFTFRLGRIAALVLDIRAHRGPTSDGFQIFSDEQKAQLPSTLEALGDAPVLVIGLSVPFLSFPPAAIDLIGRLLPAGNNIQDRWAFADSRPDRAWLFERLLDHADRHPRQKLIIVGGDVHIGLVSELVRRDDRPPVWQLVSSAISNTESRLVRTAVSTGSRLFKSPPHATRFQRARLASGVEGHARNPVIPQNVGFIEVQHRGNDTDVRLSLMSGQADGTPEFLFRTHVL